MVDDPVLALDRSGPLFDADAALRARLLSAFPSRQFVHHAVPARFSRATWQRLGDRAPFIATGFSRLEPDAQTGRSYRGRGVWTVFAGTKQPLIEAMLLGDRRAPGLLGMLGMVVGVLHGQTDPGIGSWSCGPAQNLYDEGWANDELGVVGIEASTPIELADARAATLLPEYLRQGTAWALPELPETIINVRGG